MHVSCRKDAGETGMNVPHRVHTGRGQDIKNAKEGMSWVYICTACGDRL